MEYKMNKIGKSGNTFILFILYQNYKEYLRNFYLCYFGIIVEFMESRFHSMLNGKK